MNETNFLTPVGRLVGGNLFQAQTKNFDGVLLTNPKWFIALAILKTDPGYAEIFNMIHAEARRGHPSLFDLAGNCVLPDFAFKITDGDSAQLNKKGRRPCDKQGYPGHWVLSFSTSLAAPQVYEQGGKVKIISPAAVTPGDYMRVYGSVNSNEDSRSPGVYLNFELAEFMGKGEHISYGAIASEVFGKPPVVGLPPGAVPPGQAPIPSGPPLQHPGASVVHVSPHSAPTPMPGGAAVTQVPPPVAAAPVAGLPIPQAAAPVVPMPPTTMPSVAVVPTAPPAAVQPAADFLQAKPPEVRYAHQGATYTAPELQGFGWTLEQIAALPIA